MRSPLVVLAALTLALALPAAGCLTDKADVTSGATCGASTAPDASWKAERPRVLLTTAMGAITLALDLEGAPITATNFLNLTRSGFYDNTSFHRVVKGFVIQGGDPNSKDANPSNDGAGGPGYDIPDEFNPTLRHDKAGVVSMATAGPDTGGSQFFLTLAPAASLDDRHAVFGRVVDGMDIVNAIAATPTRGETPLEPVKIQKAEVIEAAPFDNCHKVTVHPALREKTAEGGRAVTFAVILQNLGTTRDQVTLTATPPTGWEATVDAAPIIPAGTGRVVFLKVTPPANATGTAEIALEARSAWSGVPTSVTHVKVTLATLGAAIKQGDRVTANYVGLLPDGRLFDTSVASVGADPEQPKFTTTGGWRARGAASYQSFQFTVGTGVIPGFTNLAKTAKVGETVTALIPAADAYATGNMYEQPLAGRDLVFELQILKVG
jgi:peptidyl-prolyl cis-trans isomerase A (cyclophilin A)